MLSQTEFNKRLNKAKAAGAKHGKAAGKTIHKTRVTVAQSTQLGVAYTIAAAKNTAKNW
jgi:hypothetical protein